MNATANYLEILHELQRMLSLRIKNQRLKNMLSSESRSDMNATADYLKILHELQRIFSLRLRESEVKEYAIIKI